MSYYSPSFGGISDGRFRSNDEYAHSIRIIDEVWSDKCDFIIKKYVLKYGTYFSAFADQIIKEIDIICKANLLNDALYYPYYLSNRAYELSEVKEHWIMSYNIEKNKSFNCIICNDKQNNLNCHPSSIEIQQLPLRFCDDCAHIFNRCKPYEDEIKKLVEKRFVFNKLSKEKECEICNKTFSHIKYIKECRNFGSGGPFIDYLYPNLFADICPTCFFHAFRDNKRVSKKTQLKYLYELYEFLGRIPTQNLNHLFYLCRSHDEMISLITILKKMRTPEGFKKEFGSFFTALVHSNVIPDGVRKTAMGTMMLAEDGHVCFSKIEKEIDDYLFLQKIKHCKEIKYPDQTRIRADWELIESEKRTFVEYFGLIKKSEYAEKVEIKIQLAKKYNINLIEIYPKDNWKKILNQWISDNKN